MRLQEQKIPDAYLALPERFADDRGFFARTYCADHFREHGIDPNIAQCSVSHNPRKGTLRGMHLQAEPYGETKLVRCTRGAIYDVLIDLRPDSPTYREWIGATLTAENGRMLAVPPGVAHGFLTLAPNSEVFYQISVPYHPPSSRGVRWDDPTFSIEWPADPEIISERDRTYPDFTDNMVSGNPPTSQ